MKFIYRLVGYERLASNERVLNDVTEIKKF